MRIWAMAAVLACNGHDGTGGGGDDDDTTVAGDDDDTVAGDDDDTTTFTYTGTRVLDDDHVLIVPDDDGIHFIRADGTPRATFHWDEVTADCLAGGCGGEALSVDGDGLLFAWSHGIGNGGIGRLDVNGDTEWSVNPMIFPHDAIRDPADGTIIVPEASASRISWVPGDGSSPDPVRSIDLNQAPYDQPLPDGTALLVEGGRNYLLISNRDNSGPDHVGLWDITEPGNVQVIRRFPDAPEGLDTPHCPSLTFFDGRWWLLWAHTVGLPGESSVGVAVTDDILTMPQYVADLVPGDASLRPMVYVRGVDLTDDGTLWITDWGTLGPQLLDGRVLKATLPRDLEPTGASGGVGADQVVVEVDGMTQFTTGLGHPFEGWVWLPTIAL